MFAGLERAPALLLAVSGGPDSTALLVLAARWAKTVKSKPKLTAVTVDHGLRKESKLEAAAVGKLAKKLGVEHRVLKWSGDKPSTGIQQSARRARYALLAAAAKKAGATYMVTAHTLDDQAETMMMRMARGSGITGLGAMARRSRRDGVILARPFLDIAKARLVATLKAAKIPFADDPSNRDPKFTRARLRGLMPELAREGLDARRLSTLARRLRRADTAIEADTDRVMAAIARDDAAKPVTAIEAAAFVRLPAEIALRVLGRVVAQRGNEGPVELGKLEALFAAVLPAAQDVAKGQMRRSLAGALVSVEKGRILVETAPSRHKSHVAGLRAALTTRARAKAAKPKAR